MWEPTSTPCPLTDIWHWQIARYLHGQMQQTQMPRFLFDWNDGRYLHSPVAEPNVYHSSMQPSLLGNPCRKYSEKVRPGLAFHFHLSKSSAGHSKPHPLIRSLLQNRVRCLSPPSHTTATTQLPGFIDSFTNLKVPNTCIAELDPTNKPSSFINQCAISIDSWSVTLKASSNTFSSTTNAKSWLIRSKQMPSADAFCYCIISMASRSTFFLLSRPVLLALFNTHVEKVCKNHLLAKHWKVHCLPKKYYSSLLCAS